MFEHNKRGAVRRTLIYLAFIVSLLVILTLLKMSYVVTMPITGLAVNGIDKVEITDMEKPVNHKAEFDANKTEKNYPPGLFNATILERYIKAGSIRNKTYEAEIYNSIERAVADAVEMNNSGFGIVFVADTLISMRDAMAASDYEPVIELSDLIKERKQRAYFISDTIDALSLEIEEEKSNGLDVTEAEILLEQAAIAFNEELYDEAENMISETSVKLDDIRAEITMVDVLSKASRGFFSRNWKGITAVIIILAAIVLASYKKVREILIRRKLDILRTERKVIKELMKKDQEKHFNEGTLSGLNYKIKMDAYRKRLTDIKRRIPALEGSIRR